MALTEFQLSEGRYNARDALATARLYKPLVAALERTNTVNVYLHDREMAKLALQMQRVGMPIDNEERARVGKHLIEIRDEATTELRKYTEAAEFLDWIAAYQAVKARKSDIQPGQADNIGLNESNESAYAMRTRIRRNELDTIWAKRRAKGIDPVNFNSKVQQAALLKVAGVPLVRMSAKTGLPTVSKGTLEQFASNAAARAMLNYELTRSIIKTFIQGLPVSDDGFLRPEWAIHKITGRWGSNPNVQNWSKRAGGGAENLRRMVRAPKGYVLVCADFAQLEARILALLSREPTLLTIFTEGRDIHAEMAAIGFPALWPRLQAAYLAHKEITSKCKCDDCLARDKARDLTKRLEYGAFYGGSEQVLWQSVVKDWPTLMLRDVMLFTRAINQRMPALVKWRQQVVADIMRTREVRSPFLGRRQTFPLGRVDPGVAYNYKAQSGGADLWCFGAIDFVQIYPQTEPLHGRIIHNGHDSVMVLSKESEASKVASDINAAWSRTIDGMTFKLDVRICERWSDA